MKLCFQLSLSLYILLIDKLVCGFTVIPSSVKLQRTTMSKNENKGGNGAAVKKTRTMSFLQESFPNTNFDENTYEKDRLLKDKKAMDDMKKKSEAALLGSTGTGAGAGAGTGSGGGGGGGDLKVRTPWKWEIRKRIWDMMEEKDIAKFPRPVHHRIPNFVGAEIAAENLKKLPEFINAKIVKVNPDTPQRPVRHAVLELGKTLLTPQPRLRTGFFSILEMKEIRKIHSSQGNQTRSVRVEECSNSKGVVKFGKPVTLNDKYTVDIVVVGSTAVCPNTGARVGKGEGFAELEWGILSCQGNLNASTTLVVTTVHDEQIVSDIPAEQLTKHDVPVDIIVTPTKIIRVPNRAPKPSGIYWDLLSKQKLAQIKVLRQLKQQIEKEDNIQLPFGPDEKLPPTASRNNKKKKSQNNTNRNNNNNNNNMSKRNTNNEKRNNSNNDKNNKSKRKPQQQQQPSAKDNNRNEKS